MTEVLVRRPSMARYRALFGASADQSILRCLEYERLAELRLTGRVLDFGGGRRTNYASQIPRWGLSRDEFIYEAANIDPNTEPTYLLAPGGPLPVADASFDAALSLNTLEHVYEFDAALAELNRVLKPGGRLVLVVPFIFRVHGHPDDYTRGTPSFWTRRLTQHLFCGVTIEALNWGPFSTAQSVSGLPGPFKGLRRRSALLLDVLYAIWRKDAGTTHTVPQDHETCAAPLAYFIEATKPNPSLGRAPT